MFSYAGSNPTFWPRYFQLVCKFHSGQRPKVPRKKQTWMRLQNSVSSRLSQSTVARFCVCSARCPLSCSSYLTDQGSPLMGSREREPGFIIRIWDQRWLFRGKSHPTKKNPNPGDFKSHGIFTKKCGIPIPGIPRDFRKSPGFWEFPKKSQKWKKIQKCPKMKKKSKNVQK